MKTSNLLAAALILTVGLTACSNEEEVINGSDVVQISSSIDKLAPVSRANIEEYSGTGEFEDGDIWGMYAYASGNPTAVLSNGTYTVGSTTYYWNDLSAAVPVTFSAHYPRITVAIADPAAYTFNAATAPNPDLLVATTTASNGNNVNLSFKHVMHQLVIQLGGNMSDVGNILQADVSLLNMKSSAKVNLRTGEVDLPGASGTSAYATKIGSTSFFVAPQNLTANTDWIRIDLEGKTYTYKVPASITNLQSGKRLTLTLTLVKGGSVNLTKAISGWISQTTDPIEENVTED